MAWNVDNRGRAGDDWFRRFLQLCLIVGVVFVFLSMLSGSGFRFFLWPLFGYGIGVFAPLFILFMVAAPFIIAALVVVWFVRAISRPAVPPPPRQIARQEPVRVVEPPAAAAQPPTELTRLVAEAERRVDAMRTNARRISAPVVRARTLDICATADQILAVLIETPTEAGMARDFLTRYLMPAEEIVSRYSRLAGRGLASAEETLSKVEDEDLPLLDRKFEELYDRLHRGDLIDLQVAREMLQLDFATIEKEPAMGASTR